MCLFIPGLDRELKAIQSQVAKVTPGLRDLETDFHCTLAYASGLDAAGLTAALPGLRQAIAGRSFDLHLGPLADLTNQKGEGVVYLKAASCARSACPRTLRWRILVDRPKSCSSTERVA